MTGRILAGDQAPIERTLPLVAPGRGTGAGVLRVHQVQVLLAAGNLDIDAAPVWRKVG